MWIGKMVCDGLSGCTYNIEIHTAEGKKLRDIVVPFFKKKKEKLMPESLHLQRQLL